MAVMAHSQWRKGLESWADGRRATAAREAAARGGRTAREGPEGALLEMDGQKAMVIHPPSRERHSVRPSAVRLFVRPLSVANWRGIRGLCNQGGERKEEYERRISARAQSEESNRCQLGEMREERGDDDYDDDDDERRRAGTVLIG